MLSKLAFGQIKHPAGKKKSDWVVQTTPVWIFQTSALDTDTLENVLFNQVISFILVFEKIGYKIYPFCLIAIARNPNKQV